MEEVLPIYIYGAPQLKEVAEEIDSDYPELDIIIQKMKNALASTETGVGLAATQVGIPIRLFLGPDNRVFINPEILELKGTDKLDFEGCLSIPLVYARIVRPQKVKLKYFDENWEEQIKLFKNLDARIIQHEIDHLDGICFVEKITKERLENVQSRLDALLEGDVPDVSYEYVEPEVIEDGSIRYE